MKPRKENKKKWILTWAILSLIEPLGLACTMFGFIVLVGYSQNIEVLYRPIFDGPATNPLTAITIIILGISIYLNRKSAFSILLQKVLAIMGLLIVSSRISDIFLNTNISTLITPFHSQLLIDAITNKKNAMGLNTVLMCFFIGLAILSNNLEKKSVSQFCASISISIPMITLVGYAYGLEKFYGQMSIFTASVGLPLSFASLALTANHGFFRALLSPHMAGKISRYQVTIGYLFPILFGYILIRSLLVSQLSIFSFFVVGVCWFIVVMICFSAFFLEKVDQKRRSYEKQLHQAAITDALTELPNRRQFFNLSYHELLRGKRLKNQLWIFIIDIDYFKKVNDTAGHKVGDHVLKKISQALKNSLREIDIIGRIGGEEFAVLISDVTKEGAIRLAENLRTRAEKATIKNWTDIYGPITVSIGGSQVDCRMSVDLNLDNADKALYQAKNNGRNQVCFSL